MKNHHGFHSNVLSSFIQFDSQNIFHIQIMILYTKHLPFIRNFY